LRGRRRAAAAAGRGDAVVLAWAAIQAVHILLRYQVSLRRAPQDPAGMGTARPGRRAALLRAAPMLMLAPRYAACCPLLLQALRSLRFTSLNQKRAAILALAHTSGEPLPSIDATNMREPVLLDAHVSFRAHVHAHVCEAGGRVWQWPGGRMRTLPLPADIAGPCKGACKHIR
jgi:hypothetical protein